MITYKIDVLTELEKAGFPQKRLRAEKLIGQSSITNLRKGNMVGINVLETLCELLNMQPGDIIEYKLF